MDNEGKFSVNKRNSLKNDGKDRWEIAWHKPCVFYKPNLVNKLWPMLVMIGSLEIAVGIILLIVLVLYSQEFDKIYSSEYNKAITSSTFVVLFILALTGSVLLISLILDRRRLMLIYILLSTILCTYIFALSAFEIHYGILKLRTDSYNKDTKREIFNTACILGIITMLSSVVHFIGILAVITFYSFKYFQPRLQEKYELVDNT
ncbi:uncharacterized protein LOC116778187 [Danaus plexippus]|uniref:uncharacterized protein LOC116778187 n=1 Tax=Danaus plexippus TaxID=13037 RepID=UPI002AB05FD5|nr:uncharacterized protein LOC116778187 [Danaus plexippus]